MLERAVRIEPDLWRLDLDFQGRSRVIAAYLVTGPAGHTLIETGPGSTLGALEAGIQAAGARLEDVTQLLVTHIHLDHAGAAGTLLRRLPAARLFVHPAGAPHLIDPSKLIASATRIYGDRMDALWGAFEPCPAARVTLLNEGDAITCGERTLHALHTPGHAIHHVAFHDAERRTVFTGDIAGVRIPGASFVRPPTPPPDIDMEAWHRSVSRLRELELRAMDLTHFGRFDDVERHLDELVTRLESWTRWTADRLEEGADAETMAVRLRREVDLELVRQHGASDEQLASYELATPTRMNVDGIVRYLTRRPKR